MRETLIRRLLVIVLCASGVVALWIVADRAVSIPDAANSAVPETNSRSGPNPAPAPISSTPDSSTPNSSTPGPPAPASAGAGSQHGSYRTDPAGSGGPRTDPISHRTHPSNRQPAGQQLPTVDPQPPAVRGVRVIQTNHDSITIRWNPVRNKAAHDPAISYYSATLNGIPAGETAGLELTINWFNDDMAGSHFIRVRAVDADGNRGQQSNPLVVDRPSSASPRPPSTAAPGATSPAPDSSPTPPASRGTASPGPQDVAAGTPDPTTEPSMPPTTAPTGGASNLPAAPASQRAPADGASHWVAPNFQPSPTGRS